MSSLSKLIQDAIESRILALHTMLPGKVVKVDVTKGKCDVQPLLKRLGPDGEAIDLPVIMNCPIGFYRAGVAAVYLPLKVDDQVEIRFCERSLDIWLEKGGTVDPEDRRKHHLSDAVAYPGLYDFSKAPKAAHADHLVVVNDKAKATFKADGEVFIENENGSIKMTSGGKFAFTGVSEELVSLFKETLTELKAIKQMDTMAGIIPAFDTAGVATITGLETRAGTLVE